MTTRSQRRRPGVTLMEVLIATFILSIGLLAIMALFPIGAVNMARAINQDRSATHGVNSDAVFRYYWKQAWNDPNGGNVRPTWQDAYLYSQEPFLVQLQAHATYGTPAGTPIPDSSSQPGFVVLVDPVGYLTKSGADQFFVAGNAQLPMRTTLRRCILYPNANPNPILIPGYSTSNLFPPGQADPNWRNPPPAGPLVPYQSIIPAVVRLTTLPDDMTFAIPNDGSVAAVHGEPADFTNQIERVGRYNSAWLLHRPRTDVPSEVHVSVLVYAGRSPTDTPSAETAYPNTIAAPGQTAMLIPLPAGQAQPGIRRGGWIGFSHLVDRTPPPANTPVIPYPTLDFYRITGINTDNPNVVVVELETPIKVAGPVAPNAPGYVGAAIVMDNLVEVFERGTVSAAGVTR